MPNRTRPAVKWGWGAIAAAVLVLVAVMLLNEAAPVVEAHAALIRSNPQNGSQERRPPARVILYFSETVEPKLTSIDVFDVDGNEVDENDVTVDETDARIASVGVPTLAPGLYTVEFSNVSTVDGHPWSGVFQFIILNPDGTVPPNAEFDPDAGASASTSGLLPKNIDAALKWIALVALAVVVGATVFALAVVRPAASFMEDDDRRTASDAGDTWVVVLAHVLLPAAFIAEALLVVISISRFEISTPLFEYLTTVRTGRYQLANLTLVAVALAGADVLYLTSNRRLRQGGLAVLLVAGLGAMATYSMISHGAAGEGRFWSILADLVHFGASAMWLGALVLLVPLIRFARRAFSDETARFLYLANAFDRFSILAGISVATVMVTGVFNGLVQIPARTAFTDTTYGRVLLAKLAIVALLLPVAALNAFILKPRLVAAIDGAYQAGGATTPAERESWAGKVRQLQRLLPMTIIAEVVLVIAVFASVAVLTQTSTAKGEIAQQEAAEAASTEFEDVKTSGDLQLGIAIQPNRVGINRYTLTIRNADGSPADDVTQARLRFSYTDPSQPDVRPPAAELLLRRSPVPGEWEGQGSYFTQVGSWLVEAGVRRTDADDVSRTFSVPVAPSESIAEEEGGPFALPFSSLSWNEVLGALLAVVGVMIILYRAQFRGIARQGYRIAVTGATALILAGAVLWFGVENHQAIGNPSAGNPIEASEESIETGRMLFQNNCATCHGAEGRGDGPQAAELDPAPADIRQHLPYHTDPQFFAFIADGIGGTAMPAWRDTFSDEEIWHLVNYLRTFQDVSTE